MPLLLPIDQNHVGLDSAVCRESYGAVAQSLCGPHSFGGIDFAVRAEPFTVVSV